MKKKNRAKKAILQNKINKKNQKNDELNDDYNVENIIKDGFDNSDESDTDESDKSINAKRNSVQTLRQEIELLKVDTIAELTLKYLTQDKSVVIFVNFTKTIELLSSKLNTQCIIWGSQTIKERTKSIDDFCSDKSRIIICNIQSGSAGISLHDTHGKFARVSIISPTWSAQDLIQVLGRVHRAMGKTDCLQQLIFCKGTIEESVGNIIRQKITNIRSFNDGNKNVKKDNMEVILKSELSKKVKKQDESTYIYKTNDFEAIQERIDNLEYIITKTQKELTKYTINSHEYKECEFKIRKLEQELNFNVVNLNNTIASMC
jgi:superfamily II DNA or RNA helicase